MSDDMNPITDFFLWCSMTDQSALEKLPSDHYESSRNIQLQLGIFVFLTAFFALISGTYAAYIITESVYSALPLGLLFSAFVFSLDRFIVSQFNKWTLLPRLILAMVLAIIIAIPLELRINREPIHEAIQEETRIYNEELRESLSIRYGLPRIQDRIEELIEIRSIYREDRDRQRIRMEAEETGEIVAGWGSGIPGKGDLYDAAEKRLESVQIKLDELQIELVNQEAKEREVLAEISQAFREKKEDVNQGLAKNIKVLESLKQEDEILWRVGWGLKILFLLFEISPLFMKALNESYYSRSIRLNNEKDRFEKKAKRKIIKNEMKAAIADHEDIVNTSINNKDSSKFSIDDARDTYRLFKEKNSSTSAFTNSLNKAATNKNGHKRKPRSKAHQNGQIPLNPITILVIGITLFILAELLTPIAPVQQMMGAAMLTVPKPALQLLIGEKAAENFMNADSLLALYQSKPEIRSAEGDLIYAGTPPNGLPATFSEILIYTENHRFKRVFVIDYFRTLREMFDRVFHKRIPKGTSGITQQLARGVILDNYERNLLRKVKELLIATGLRKKYTDEELIEFYAYSVFLGRDLKGFHQAAYEYFNRSLNQLTTKQMVALVAILPAPNTYINNSDKFEQRYNSVVNRLADSGIFTDFEINQLAAQIPSIHVSNGAFEQRMTMRQADIYLTQMFGDRKIIQTTLDADISSIARNTLLGMTDDVMSITGVTDADGFILISHNQKLIAMIGSVDPFGTNQATQVSVWAPGSVLKPLIYSEFLNQGNTLYTKVPVQPRIFATERNGNWHVENSQVLSQDIKDVTVLEALSSSLNVPVAEIAVSPVSSELRNKLSDTVLRGYFDDNPASFLGPKAVRPIDLFHVLHAFVPPLGSIPNQLQMKLNQETKMKKLWEEDIARDIVFGMSQSVEHPSGVLHPTVQSIGWSGDMIAGKTGTTQQNRSASLFITTPGEISILAGVFSRSGQPLRSIQPEYANITGSFIARYMDEILKSESLQELTDNLTFLASLDSND
ncbi:DUF4407 domain-containing protein [Rhodohalobacter mucosus]|uniref:Glycosyl transferase family 51 domain-containing protein n=1 Tax=Rhodohalobacter mucosus TaxID=2079485 RepID=A0A316TTQ9_9BACT|nr:DUF4407 domain-containing protein [Rhodohalobacter mucosus]PWN06365.1 hypothetical protein DDZ15_11125 [Rhodohalobacter mucosus]